MQTTEEDEPLLSHLSFRYPLRRYQTEILDLVDEKLKNGEREIHIVAPPGAGKTIIGLQLIANFKRPALILAPNTTIQSQWGQKLDLFLPPDQVDFGCQDIIGTHEDKPLKPVTVMTYQVLSTPGKEQEYLTKLSHRSWVDELVKGRGLSIGEAELRILELLQNNPKAHQKEMSRHASRLRKKLADIMDLNEVLHPNAVGLLQALRRQKFKLILFDECHHLTDYWAAIMLHLIKYLDDPLVIGLTGTPPEKKSSSQEGRYVSLVGAIDYQVPTPALVKEGGLAPFQDLVYFVEPTAREFDFLEEQHEEFHKLLEELCGADWLMGMGRIPQAEQEVKISEGRAMAVAREATKSISLCQADLPPLTAYVIEQAVKIEKEIGFDKFLKESPALAQAYLRALWKLKLPRPRKIEFSEELTQAPVIDDWMIIIDDFAAHKLKLSSSKEHHDLFERIKQALRKLGFGITEQGLRKQASPVDRVLAFSQAKSKAVTEILALEYRVLDDRLRACVVTDFERMSATAVKNLEGVLNEESGGALAVMRTLLASPIALYVNPCLVTGSLLLIDQSVAAQFQEAAEIYLKENGYDFKLNVEEHTGGFSQVSANSGAWESRLYVAMATSIFERGITKCLIGTRGLFGEGWDSQSLNTLIDLTTTTAPVSVKQLRGRSIRIQTEGFGARKVANNWDVVCIAPSLEKGLNDYQRFVRKHDGFFGICDDGQIECGVGHVHPSFSELTGSDVFASVDVFNREMMERALVRDKIYDHWKIGEPYNNRLVPCLEVSKLRNMALTPPHIRKNQKYKEHAGQMRSALNGVYFEYLSLGSVAALVTLGMTFSLGALGFTAVLPVMAASILARLKANKLKDKFFHEICRLPGPDQNMEPEENLNIRRRQGLTDIACAVLTALSQTKHLPPIKKESLQVTVRSDGSYRVFLDDVEPRASKVFNQALKEVLAPIGNQPFLIPKYEFPLSEGQSEEESRRFFNKYLSGRAEPRVAAYHAVPALLARSEKGREAFQECWNKYVSPGFIVSTETKPELLNKYFGIGPSLAQRLLWE
ncbi:MAG: DEAD/DEAH box helicase family protein [Candidatus Melainabacteria bacterium]|nr:DEAD/DEAH box helicase family protein [Candidatus Melainabacteria bacterium]